MATIQIDRLLETCVRRGASDLHLAVGRPPTLRLHGHLRELQTKTLEPEDTMSLMKSITPDRIQQEFEETGSGDFGFAYGDEARFRVSIFKQKGYCSLVLRRIPNKLMTFEQIGLPKMAEQICRRPRGIFLVTGPTGSGKTTTLACMINWINENFDRHIITMEDPIEYYHPHKKSIVVQREIGVDVPNFAESIRRALRQDPDVMLVGEMRDLATISAAITAAETGHLVFGTLHTSGAASTINRIIDAFPTDQQEQIRVQLANNLIAVLSQTLCPRCDQEGRVAAYEFMYVTPGIQNLIRENKSFRIDSEIQTGKKYGMQLLDDHLWALFQAGKISAEEAVDKSKNPGAMVDRMRRAGVGVQTEEEYPDAAEQAESATGSPGGRPGSAQSEAERQAQIAANRARMQALNQRR
ncbi:MAG: PilT/PilU family type 4a pilus ATPase [Phycisphaerae bacterium]|nr:PilT/PilU family type 4a pilus ATPase [Phycisphaerae bacterium]MDW8261297.1 PilT/PilU family type 4a pilus ATPase [Phycisphaerales bacterium]